MSLRIFLVGASGTLGSAVHKALAPRHDVITGGRSSGDIRIDLADAASIVAAFDETGAIDAVVSCAGHVTFAPFADFAPENFGASKHTLALSDKLLGQVNLTHAAMKVLKPRGSVTLISGILSDNFIIGGVSASMTNGALESFVRAASIEAGQDRRVNIVSPTLFEESVSQYGAFFPGFIPVPVARAAQAFVRSVEGAETGQVYKVYG